MPPLDHHYCLSPTFGGLAALLLVTLVVGCAKREAPAAAQGSQVLRISQRNEPADLDPANATLPDEFFIIRALSEGLVAPAPSGTRATALPAAATRWEISADALTYTFHLDPAAQWSNGEPVTADDFLQSYRRALTPTTLSPKASLFFAVKNARPFATRQISDFGAVGFRAADAHTLVITLERPSPGFLLYVASGPWIPVNPRTVEKHGRAWTRPGNFVGNGPFVLNEWSPNQRIVVTKNPRYHAANTVKLDEIDFVAFDSGDTEERAYRAGQIDVTMAVPTTKLETYARERPQELHHAPLAETRYLSFNTTRPPLDDVRVRRALSLALDRKQLTDRLLRGGQEPAQCLLAPALSPAGSNMPKSSAAADAIDPSVEARRLLAEAGFPEGRGFPQLELSTWMIGAPVTEAIQQMWKTTLGVTVAIVTREARVHIAALRNGNYDVAFITAIPDVPDSMDVLDEFTTGASGNYPHWSDARYDELIGEASRATAQGQRYTLLAAAESRLLEQAPLAPLYFNARNWLMSPRVRGWQYDALWTRFYLNVYLDEQ